MDTLRPQLEPMIIISPVLITRHLQIPRRNREGVVETHLSSQCKSLHPSKPQTPMHLPGA